LNSLRVGGTDGSTEIKNSTRKVHLYDFLRCGPQLVPMRQKSLVAFNELRQEIDEALASSKEYPWPALMASRPPKFYCDLVESVLGALFIDTRGDMSVCESFAARLGIFKHMERILDDHVDTLSPKERMGIIADQEAVRYVNSREQDGMKRFTCAVVVGERSVATVVDCGSKEEAEVKAAYKACKILGTRGERKRKVDVAGLRSDEADGAMRLDGPSKEGAVEME
jgi:dsRNA-specific ribonuclease